MGAPSLIEIAIGSAGGTGKAGNADVERALKACFDAAKAGDFAKAADAFCLAIEAHECGASSMPDEDEEY